MNAAFYIPCKLLLYGAADTGKTTLISRLLSVDSLAAYRLHKKDLMKNPRAGLHIEDTTGVVILYDITDKSSLNLVERYTIEVQHAAPGAPVVLVGTKLDLRSKETLSEAEVQQQLSVSWHHYSLHCQISALHGHGMNTLIAAALGIPFIRRRHAELAKTSLEWSVTMEQAMLWAFDHNMNNLVMELKQLGMSLTPTVVQLHSQAIERHLVHMQPWQPVNVHAALRGSLCSNSWKKIVMLTEEQQNHTVNELDEEDLAELDRMTWGGVPLREDAFEVVSESTLAKSVKDEKEQLLFYPVKGYCVLWQSMALQGFHSAWLFHSCSGLSPKAITHLNLSHNQLTFLPVDVYQLPSLLVLRASHNLLTDMPKADLWVNETNLQLLDLSHNCIKCFINVEAIACTPSPPLRRSQSEYRTSATGVKRGPEVVFEARANSTSSRRLTTSLLTPVRDPTSRDSQLSLSRQRAHSQMSTGNACQNTPHRHQLWLVDLSHNQLQEIPEWLLNLPSLIHLDLSHNLLEKLPTSLSPSSNLHRLIVTEAKNVPRHVLQAGPVALLCQLRQNQLEMTSSIGGVDRRLTVVVFGPEGCGKTALLSKLTGKKRMSMPGVHFFRWKFRIPFDRLSLFQKQYALIDFWDFSGTELYRPLHRCVHSYHALHLAVCSLANRRQTCQQLATYMVQLQAASVEPLNVLIVFTHIDVCGQKKAEREAAKKQCLQWINRLMAGDTMVDGVSWPNNCQPRIIGHIFTSAVTSEGISDLNAHLSSIVMGSGGDGLAAKPITVTTSLSLHCQKLEKVVREGLQNGRQRLAPLVPVARLWEELCSPKQSNGMMFINSKEELMNMLEQLHQCGLLLYYPLTLSSPALVMTEPELFCSLINNLVKVGDKWARIAGSSQGVISETHLVMALSEHLPGAEDTVEVPADYLRILEESGVCCQVGDGQIFLPSSLPANRPSTIMSLKWSHQTHSRIFQLPYLSPLFWSALLILLAKDLNRVIPQSYKDDALVTTNGTTTSNETGLITRQEKHSVRQLAQFWRHGVLLQLPDRCQVLLCTVNTEQVEGCKSPEALEVRVDGVCGQLHIKLLHVFTNAIVQAVKKQFPNCSLEDGSMFQCLVSCPACWQQRVAQILDCHFSLADCLMLLEAWTGGDVGKLSMPCSRQHNNIPLLDLIPDVMNADILCLLKHKAGRSQQLPRNSSNPSLASIVAAGPRKLGGGGVLVRKFLTNDTSSMALDELLQPYSKLRWHTEALLELHMSAFCMEPVNLLPQPPILHVIRPPCGTLQERLDRSSNGLRRRQIHEVLYQVVNAIIHLKRHGLTHCKIIAEKLFIVSEHPFVIRLSDDGLQPQNMLNDEEPMVIQLGLLIYKLASGQELLHGTHSIKQVMVALEHGMLRPSLDGVLKAESVAEGDKTQPKTKSESLSQLQQDSCRPYNSARLSRRCFTGPPKRRSSSVERDHGKVSLMRGISNELASRSVSQCAKLCLQVMVEKCLCQSSVEMGQDSALFQVRRSLPLCSSATQWSPAVLPHNVTCTALHTPRKWLLWATAVPRLQLGSLDLLSGHVNERRLTILPETMPHLRYKHRYVESEERATAMAIAEDAGQLWVGVEKATCGAVYVFEVPSLELLDSTDLEDRDTAVLSILALARTDLHQPRQLVLVGLACGDVLVFIASPHDSREIVFPTRQCLCRIKSGTSQPCMALAQSSSHVLCSFGNQLAVLDPNMYLQSNTAEPRYPPAAVSMRLEKVKALGDIFSGERCDCVDRRYHRLAVMRLVTCSLGVWLVQRHSSLLFLLDTQLRSCKTIVDCREVAGISDPVEAYTTALTAAGSLLWVGTRGGHVILLDGQAAVSVWNGCSVLSMSSLLIGLRCPLPGCTIRHLTALPDGALLSANAGLHAQAVCCVERKITSTRNCVGVFVLDVAVQNTSP